MRIPLVCNECLGVASVVIEPKSGGEIYLADLRDDDQYVATCAHGHTIAATLHNQKHDVLFESGAVALLCGFHREAVASFATSLERFYEFSMRVISKHLKLPSGVFDATWKHMAKSSERQFGAFVSLYAVAFGKLYAPAIDGRDAEFVAKLRNDVVHKGTIPTSSDATRFGDCVYRIIRRIDDDLSAFTEAYLDFVWRRTYDATAKLEAQLNEQRGSAKATRLYVDMILSRTDGDDSFRSQLADLGARLRMLLRAPLA